MSTNDAPETLLLLHGFTQTGRGWEGVIGSLERERYRALAPDLRGHGDARARRPATMDACIEDLLALAPERFTLAGYSMGGRLALSLALAAPERVRRLVLVSATAGIVDAGERAQRRKRDEALARELERDGLEAFVRSWGAQPLFAGQPEAIRRLADADRMRNDAAGLAASLRGMGAGAMEPLWQRLGELAMPVVVMAGERDRRYVGIAERLAAAITDARLVLVPGAGHALTLEAPVAVAAATASASVR